MAQGRVSCVYLAFDLPLVIWRSSWRCLFAQQPAFWCWKWIEDLQLCPTRSFLCMYFNNLLHSVCNVFSETRFKFWLASEISSICLPTCIPSGQLVELRQGVVLRSQLKLATTFFLFFLKAGQMQYCIWGFNLVLFLRQGCLESCTCQALVLLCVVCSTQHKVRITTLDLAQTVCLNALSFNRQCKPYGKSASCLKFLQ